MVELLDPIDSLNARELLLLNAFAFENDEGGGMAAGSQNVFNKSGLGARIRGPFANGFL